ncbi:hypothetical protein HMPREF0591_2241 [Mycobacterium parascrofulaceum ATCC BAA-614]|uniref:Uncharacterized protein n=1 Tax=Mycobacterium parascrofulaceum ATCC BAA-614 TaxID=525368 RepID=D5P7U7_9MYCO|nr:hypothetical protein HMPREF0591_2241 [Mycobacterium parascrofulaceum ATCC BAA-614]
MSAGDAVFRRIQSVARVRSGKGLDWRPTQEYLIRHTLESLLDRLTCSSHAGGSAEMRATSSRITVPKAANGCRAQPGLSKSLVGEDIQALLGLQARSWRRPTGLRLFKREE